MRGGERPGAGRPPQADVRRTALLRIPLTEAELAELMDSSGDAPTATWARDLLLSAARR